MAGVLDQRDLRDAKERLGKVYGIFRKIEARIEEDEAVKNILNCVLDELDKLVVFSEDGLPKTETDERLQRLAKAITDWLKRRG